jgi:hypothetical protein
MPFAPSMDSVRSSSMRAFLEPLTCNLRIRRDGAGLVILGQMDQRQSFAPHVPAIMRKLLRRTSPREINHSATHCAPGRKVRLIGGTYCFQT